MMTTSSINPACMEPDVSHGVPDALRVIHADLASAAGRLRRAEIHARVLIVRSLVMRIIAVTAGIAAVAIVVERLVSGNFGVALVVAIGGLLAAVAVGVKVMSGAHRQDWCDVAERLDLAAHDHNAIATALDLAEGNERTPFIVAAIASGVAAVKTCGSTMPVIDSTSSVGWRDRQLVMIGLAAVAIALLTPLPQREQSHGSLDTVGPITFASSLATADARPPLTPLPPNQDTPTAQPHTPAQLLGAGGAVGTAVGRSSRVAAMANSAGSAGTVAAGSESDSPAVPSSESAPPNAVRGDSSSIAAAGAQSLHAASFGSASSDAAHSQAPSDGSSNGESGAFASAQSTPQSTVSSGKSGREGKSPSYTAAPAGGIGAGANGEPTRNVGQRGSKVSESNEAAGGNGQGNGGGQGSPKKSRGVAPLMLGTREPDLIQGPQLAGPDERTKLQVRPESGPESPAVDTAAVQQASESPVDLFHLPPGSHAAVEQYFRTLHHDQDQPVAGAN